MSDSESINTEALEQTKAQIRALVNEIAQLAKSDLGPAEFYPAFLQRLIAALAAIGGAVWILSEGRRFRLACQINVTGSLNDEQSDEAQRHLKLLSYVLATGRSQLVPPLFSAEREEMGANPTPYLLVLAPFGPEGDPAGLVEIFQRPESAPATQRGYERFVVQMCELATEWLKSQKLREFSQRHSLWAQADQFARLVHESLDLRDTAYTIVNEGRRLIGCDRITLAIRRGRKCVVYAISGQDTVESRSNLVVALNELTSKVAVIGEPLWYEGRTDDLPPQLESAIHRYCEESYAKMITVLPLRRPKGEALRQLELKRHEASAERNESNPIIGALVVEQIETDVPREVLAQRIDLVYEHAARALSNSLEHHSVFLLPVWRAIGKSRWLVEARNLPKTLLAILMGLLLLGALFVVPTELKIGAEGQLEPVTKQYVFVNVSGTVTRVLVEDQQPVAKGDLLVETYNPDLFLELNRVEGERLTTQERLVATRRALSTRGLTEDERTKLAGQVEELTQALRSLEEQIALRKQQIEQLNIRAPISGRVLLSWDVERTLLNRKVEPGQILMAIADPTGDWELELSVPDRRMGHVNRARQDRPDLAVDFVVATDPRHRHQGRIKYVDQVTRVDPQAGHNVMVRVDIDEEALRSELRPGAKVHARIHCGPTNWGYRLFHEVLAWIQTRLLF